MIGTAAGQPKESSQTVVQKASTHASSFTLCPPSMEDVEVGR